MALTVDKIVLGHNAFFGVDHLSASRGQEKANYFARPERIVEIMELAVQSDVNGMMMSTHSRASDVLAVVKKRTDLSQTIRFYPLLPYVQKFVVAANQKGMVNAVLDALEGASGAEKLKTLWSGARGVLSKDFRRILSSLIQVELLPFRGFHTPTIFLHDAFTDLALALELKEVFEFYIEEIARNFKSEAAFATKNLPALLRRFKEYGFRSPLIMAHVNACGFNMNPGRVEVEEALRNMPARVMAMSTLASGHLDPESAFSYLATVPGIESVVVGVSSHEHLRQTVGSIRKHLFSLSSYQKSAA